VLKILPDEQRIFDRQHVCLLNTTMDICLIKEKPPVYYGPDLNRSRIMNKKTRKLQTLTKKVMGMPLLTDKTWSQIIENTSPIKKSISGHFSDFMGQATVKLVIFIMADCGYCEIMMPSFANLTHFAERLCKHSLSALFQLAFNDQYGCKGVSTTIVKKHPNAKVRW